MILGYGEVGKALHSIVGGEVQDPDKGFRTTKKGEVLNVCIPYTERFVQIVQEAIEMYEPTLTIIHSTVPVGTTRKLGNVAYSFTRGKHPNMTEMIKYIKHIGAVDPKIALQAKTYLESFGFQTMIHYTPESVEFGKLFDTTYYGVCIALIKEAKGWADHYGVDWSNIETINRTYNMGVRAAGHPEFVRPDLIPMEGKIKGHCVRENSNILQKDFESKLLEAIVEAK
jgi:hypothetical protein